MCLLKQMCADKRGALLEEKLQFQRKGVSSEHFSVHFSEPISLCEAAVHFLVGNSTQVLLSCEE